MGKEEYLARLRVELMDLRVEERNRWLDYYGELIDDALEDGATEAEVTASLGTVEELAARIRENGFDPAAPGGAAPDDESAGPIPGRGDEKSMVFEVRHSFRSLELENDAGDIRLAVSPDGMCLVEAVRTENFTCRVEVQGDVLSVRGLRTAETAGRSLSWKALFSGDLSFGRTGGDITVYLPEGDYRALSLRTMSGDAELPRSLGFGEGKLSTVSGDINVRSAFRRLRAESASGDMELEGLSLESLFAHTASGDVSLRGVAVQEKLRLETASGDIRLEDCVCAVLELQTASGDVDTDSVLARDHAEIRTASGDVDLGRFDTGEAMVNTASGDVEIGLLRGKMYEVSTRRGDVRCPDPVPGAGRLRVNTVSGDVHIFAER